MKTGIEAQMVVVEIRVNGVAYSSEIGSMSTTYALKGQPAENLKMNDLLQLYGRRDGTGDCFVRNFQLGLTKFVNNDP